MMLAEIFGVASRSAQDQRRQVQVRNHAIAAVLTAGDATVISARVATGSTATVVMSRRERALVFSAAGLRPLPRPGPTSCR